MNDIHYYGKYLGIWEYENYGPKNLQRSKDEVDLGTSYVNSYIEDFINIFYNNAQNFQIYYKRKKEI